jgi:hypothetical protein
VANLTTLTPIKREKFLKALAAGASVAKAAKAAGWSRQSAYLYRRENEEFAEEWDAALEAGTDLLEDEALRRATEGLVRYKFDKHGDPLLNPKTNQPYFERQYSDTLLIVMLKARRPDKYRERASIEHSGKVQSQNVPADLSQLSKAELNQLENLLAKTDPDAPKRARRKSAPPPG